MNPILVVDDEPRHRELYRATLVRAGFATVAVASAPAAIEWLAEHSAAMVVSDVRMPGMDGLALLREVRGRDPALPLLLITAFPEIRDAVQALKVGAVDYLEKPIDLDELVGAVRDALQVPAAEVADLAAIPPSLLAGIVTASPLMQRLLRDAWRVARSDAAVLLTGESGSGKEVVARFIHAASDRFAGPFVAVNCGAIPSELLASELFGHVRGAFTGAHADRRGRFREADGGTLLLDEIGELPVALQPTLLRALETGCVTPVGHDRELTANCRIIAATNRNLEQARAAGTFREDLFFRLEVIALTVPPLRDRPEDILPLARHFLAAAGLRGQRFSPAAASRLREHGWPGNVRELANAIQRAAILASTEVILPEHLPAAIASSSPGSTVPAKVGAVQTVDQAEAAAIRAALAHTGGNRTRTAELLGLSRRALIYKLKRYGLE